LFQFGPRFQKGGDAFLPVGLASIFQRVVSFEALLVGFQSVAEGHLSPSNGLVGFGTFAFLLVEIAQAQFGDTDAVSFERFPNQLAAKADSRIIVSRLDVAHEIWPRAFSFSADLYSRMNLRSRR